MSKSKVYSFGRYFIGLDYQFKIFPANVHYIDIEDAKSFTADKLEVNVGINISLKYTCNKNLIIL